MSVSGKAVDTTSSNFPSTTAAADMSLKLTGCVCGSVKDEFIYASNANIPIFPASTSSVMMSMMFSRMENGMCDKILENPKRNWDRISESGQ